MRTNARFLWEILGRRGRARGRRQHAAARAARCSRAARPPAERTDGWLIAAAALRVAGGADARRRHAALGVSPGSSRRGFRLNGAADACASPLRLGDERALAARLRRQRAPACQVRARRPAHHVLSAARAERRGRVDRAASTAAPCGRGWRRPTTASIAAPAVPALRVRRGHRRRAPRLGRARGALPGADAGPRARRPGACPAPRSRPGAVLVVLEAMKMEHSLTRALGRNGDSRRGQAR